MQNSSLLRETSNRNCGGVGYTHSARVRHTFSEGVPMAVKRLLMRAESCCFSPGTTSGTTPFAFSFVFGATGATAVTNPNLEH